MTEQKPHQEPRSGEPAGLARRDHAWDEWAHSLRCDAVVWVTIMAWLSAYRCLVAWPEITSIAPSEALTALLTGARFAASSQPSSSCRRWFSGASHGWRGEQ
jgi:hypothetical protein